MDPVTAIGLIGALVGIVTGLSHIGVRIRNSKNDVAHFFLNLEQEILFLEAFVQHMREIPSELPIPNSIVEAVRNLESCGVELKERLERCLVNRHPQRVLILWEKNDVGPFIERIRRLKNDISIVVNMTMDLYSFASNVKALNGLSMKKAWEWMENNRKCSLDYAKHRDRRQQGTCEWIFRREEFKTWMNNGTWPDRRHVWVSGIAGAGKSVLAASVVTHMRLAGCSEVVQHGKLVIPCFYFFFSYADRGHDHMALLRWLVGRFCRYFDCVPDEIEAAYRSDEVLGLRELERQLTAFLARTHTLYLVIDGVDEAEPLSEVLEVLQHLSTNEKYWQVRILSTSRRHAQIEHLMMGEQSRTQHIRMEIGAKDDICELVHQKLLKAPFDQWAGDLRAKVEHAVSHGAKGMFRWVECQMDRLGGLIHSPADEIIASLEHLPKTLYEMYDRVIVEIPEDRRKAACRLLMWICVSTELNERLPSMAAAQLYLMMRDDKLEPEDDQVKLEATVRGLKHMLVSLITMGTIPDDEMQGADFYDDDDPDTFELAHYTVFEYLMDERLDTMNEPADKAIVAANFATGERGLIKTYFEPVLDIITPYYFDHWAAVEPLVWGPAIVHSAVLLYKSQRALPHILENDLLFKKMVHLWRGGRIGRRIGQEKRKEFDFFTGTETYFSNNDDTCDIFKRTSPLHLQISRVEDYEEKAPESWAKTLLYLVAWRAFPLVRRLMQDQFLPSGLTIEAALLMPIKVYYIYRWLNRQGARRAVFEGTVVDILARLGPLKDYEPDFWDAERESELQNGTHKYLRADPYNQMPPNYYPLMEFVDYFPKHYPASTDAVLLLAISVHPFLQNTQCDDGLSRGPAAGRQNLCRFLVPLMEPEGVVDSRRYLLTPLQLATYCRDAVAVQLLLERGADPNLANPPPAEEEQSGEGCGRAGYRLPLTLASLPKLDEGLQRQLAAKTPLQILDTTFSPYFSPPPARRCWDKVPRCTGWKNTRLPIHKMDAIMTGLLQGTMSGNEAQAAWKDLENVPDIAPENREEEEDEWYPRP